MEDRDDTVRLFPVGGGGELWTSQASSYKSHMRYELTHSSSSLLTCRLFILLMSISIDLLADGINGSISATAVFMISYSCDAPAAMGLSCMMVWLNLLSMFLNLKMCLSVGATLKEKNPPTNKARQAT